MSLAFYSILLGWRRKLYPIGKALKVMVKYTVFWTNFIPKTTPCYFLNKIGTKYGVFLAYNTISP
jgi:hypothetical protein